MESRFKHSTTVSKLSSTISNFYLDITAADRDDYESP